MSLVSYEVDSSGSEEEGEGSRASGASKTGKTQDVRELLSVLPNRDKKQPVRLSVPVLSRGQKGDSDSEDDVPPPTKRSSKTGLAALLPPPKQVKGSKIVTKPTSAQSMVPYTLSKRAQAAAARQRRGVAPPKSKASSKSIADNDSDDDDSGPVSFFQLESTDPTLESHNTATSDTSAVAQDTQENLSVIQTAPNAPRPFTASELEQPQTVYYEPLTATTETESPGNDELADRNAGPLLGAGPGLSMDTKAFRRLTGGRKQGRRDPTLNDLIEVNEDEVKVESELYRKHYSEDAIDKLYKPPEGEKPTAQQKRKHQLTFLAHEAKANELKLLKQWGQSAASRRDTQMKYGF